MQRSTARFAFRVTRGMLGAAPLLQRVLDGSVADPKYMPTRLVARYLAPFTGENGVNHLLKLAAAVRSADVADIDLQTIRVPTLVIRGDADQWVSADIASQLENEIPNARLIRVAHVGRLVPEEDPEALCEVLLKFLAVEPAAALRK
jgi:pimeloyl-ACP methyl ester carboxylesterase